MERKEIDVQCGKDSVGKAVFHKGEKRVWGVSDITYDDVNEYYLVAADDVKDTQELIDLLNYAEDLKVRARIRTAHTDVASKTQERKATTLWLMVRDRKQGTTVGTDLLAKYMMDTKGLNTELDKFYSDNQHAVDNMVV